MLVNPSKKLHRIRNQIHHLKQMEDWIRDSMESLDPREKKELWTEFLQMYWLESRQRYLKHQEYALTNLIQDEQDLQVMMELYKVCKS